MKMQKRYRTLRVGDELGELDLQSRIIRGPDGAPSQFKAAKFYSLWTLQNADEKKEKGKRAEWMGRAKGFPRDPKWSKETYIKMMNRMLRGEKIPEAFGPFEMQEAFEGKPVRIERSSGISESLRNQEIEYKRIETVKSYGFSRPKRAPEGKEGTRPWALEELRERWRKAT